MRVAGHDGVGLRGGAIEALVVQDPVRMGYLAVTAMHTLLSGGKPEKRIDTGERLLRRAGHEPPAPRGEPPAAGSKQD